MADVRVAYRYAEALFAVAKEHGLIQSVSDDLNAMVSASRNGSELGDLIRNPVLKREDKEQILDKVLSDRVTALTMQLVRVLLAKRRESLIPEVGTEFERLRREDGNIAHITVTSSVPLSDKEKQAIVKKVETSSSKTVEAEFEIDPSILGGVKVQIGNHVLDGTVQGSLNRLRDRLTYDVLRQI